MSVPAYLRVYRFDPGAAFEGGLVGAIERIDLGRETKLLDALFVMQDTGGLAALDLAGSGAGDMFASLVDFRLDQRRREALTERTLAERRGGVPRTLIEAIAGTLEAGAAIFAVVHTGGKPTVLDDAVERAHGRLIADASVDAQALADAGPQLFRAVGIPARP